MIELNSHTADTLIMCISLILCVGMFGLLLIRLTRIVVSELARLHNITYDYYETNCELMQRFESNFEILAQYDREEWYNKNESKRKNKKS